MTAYLLQFGFSWTEFLFGGEDPEFLFETGLRSFVMFLVIVISLRILGKRGVKQLSVFELVVIIGLGSAAGDPMFYKDVGILPALIVFIMIISLYRFMMFAIGKSKRFEQMVEGKSVCLINEGRFSIENFDKETLAQDEFFAELRLKGVSHLGQIQLGLIEITGEISLFFYEDEEVIYGLPILPDLFDAKQTEFAKRDHYSCTFCGFTAEKSSADATTCPLCSGKLWVTSSKKRRVT